MSNLFWKIAKKSIRIAWFFYVSYSASPLPPYRRGCCIYFFLFNGGTFIIAHSAQCLIFIFLLFSRFCYTADFRNNALSRWLCWRFVDNDNTVFGQSSKKFQLHLFYFFFFCFLLLFRRLYFKMWIFVVYLHPSVRPFFEVFQKCSSYVHVKQLTTLFFMNHFFFVKLTKRLLLTFFYLS